MARATAWVTRKVHTESPRVNTTTPVATRAPATTSRRMVVLVVVSTMRTSDAGGGSTPDNGSVVRCDRRTLGTSTRTPKRTTNGIAGVRFSWIGRSHVRSLAHFGMKVLKTAMRMPRPRPPAKARGRLTSDPTAAAAMATTTMLRKSPAASELKRGAIRTPASPANSDERAHADAETRLALMPLSSVILGLSTTARMRRPITVKRNRATRHKVARTATAMATSSLRLNEYTPHTS